MGTAEAAKVVKCALLFLVFFAVGLVLLGRYLKEEIQCEGDSSISKDLQEVLLITGFGGSMLASLIIPALKYNEFF